MKKMFFAFAFLLLFPKVSLAGYQNYSGTVSFIGTDWAVNRIIFGITGTTGPCPYGQFSIDDSNPNYKFTVAHLMLAFALGKTVNVTTDATNSCPNSRANIVSAILYP